MTISECGSGVGGFCTQARSNISWKYRCALWNYIFIFIVVSIVELSRFSCPVFFFFFFVIVFL